jgi:uncharacterized protein (TIGR03067 family)
LVLAFGVIAAVAAAQEDARKELEKFQGTWAYQSVEMDGKPTPPEELKNRTITFTGDRFQVKQGSEVLQAGTHKLDPTKKPKTVDATVTEGQNKGTVMLGIYELTEDSIRACFSETGKDRPTEFKTTPGANRILVVVKREKK